MGGPFTGDRAGAAVADLIASTMRALRDDQRGPDAEHASRARTDQLEAWEQELAPRLAELFSHHTDQDDLPPKLAQILGVASDPDHQVDFLLQMAAIIGLVLAILPAASSGLSAEIGQWSLKTYASLSPGIDSAVQAVVTGKVDQGTAYKWAKDNGYEQGVVNDLADLAKPTAPLGSLIELWRRKIIGAGLVESQLKDTGFDGVMASALMTLKEQIPSAELAINAYTQNQLTEGQVLHVFEQNGIDASNFPWIAATNGQSPGVDLVLELLNKRLISEGEARTAVLESPIKNKYLEAMMKARFRIPPMEQTISMVRRGAYTAAEATENLGKLGYFPADIAKLVKWATTEKLAPEHDVTQGMIVDGYRIGLLPRDKAATMLASLNYDAAEAKYILDVADAKKAQQQLDRAVSRVHSSYVAWRITDHEAGDSLDKLKIPAALRDDLIEEWNVERDVNSKHLTAAQIVDAFKKEFVDLKGATDRLLAIGYDPPDAKILIQLKVPDAYEPKA